MLTPEEIVNQLIEKNKERQRKILIAEDDYINVFWLKKMLSDLNFELHIAENGLIALEMFKEQVFDIVLMDIYMPVMDGLEATQKIREISSSVPIIAVTAADYSKGTLVNEYGFNDVFYKPVDINKLKNLLNIVL